MDIKDDVRSLLSGECADMLIVLAMTTEGMLIVERERVALVQTERIPECHILLTIGEQLFTCLRVLDNHAVVHLISCTVLIVGH